MDSVCIKIFVHELRKHKGVLLYEWILEKAKNLGLHGGSALRAISGFGCHGILHEEHFLELASNVSVEVVFYLAKEEVDKLLSELKKADLDLWYVIHPVTINTLKK